MPAASVAAAPRPDLLTAASELRVALGRIERRLRQECEDGELTSAALSALSRLDEAPSGTAALAAAERTSAPTVCAILATLQSRGLVRRDPDPTDGRRAVMTLTPAGRATLDARRSALTRHVAQTLGEAFDGDQLRQLLAALPLLCRLASTL